jgi:hypothetical protein
MKTTETTAATVAPKFAKSATITLTAPGATLQLVAERKADGSARTYAITTDTARKKTERGMTESHTNFEAAKVAIATSAAKAEQLGWSRRVAGRGFVAKPDAFTALPAALTAVTPSPKVKK